MAMLDIYFWLYYTKIQQWIWNCGKNSVLRGKFWHFFHVKNPQNLDQTVFRLYIKKIQHVKIKWKCINLQTKSKEKVKISENCLKNRGGSTKVNRKFQTLERWQTRAIEWKSITKKSMTKCILISFTIVINIKILKQLFLSLGCYH